ncbi:MAG: hypothetical protein ACLFV2_04485 [Desulfurivibrionaceae bacterium]
MVSQADIDTSGSLQELKEVIFDLDWEISDTSLDKLSSVISPLKEKWEGQKTYLVCIKIMENVGYYIKKAKYNAHPEAVKLLSSTFKTLEKIDSDESLTENDRTNLVRAELEKYNGLKEEITGEQKKGAKKTGKAKKPVTPGAVSGSEDTGPEKEAGSEDEEEKEIIPSRIDDHSFQEADKLLDDFFADEVERSAKIPETEDMQTHESGETSEEEIAAGREEKGADVPETEAAQSPEAEETAEDEESVEFDLGGKDKGKKIGKFFDASETEIETQIGEKLGLEEEEVQEKQEMAASESVNHSRDDSDQKLEAIIDQFSQELTSVIAEKLRRAVQEEMERIQ